MTKVSLEKLTHKILAGRGQPRRVSASSDAAPGGLCALLLAVSICSLPCRAVIVHTVCPSGCDYPDPESAEMSLPPKLSDTYVFEWQAGQTFTTTLTIRNLTMNGNSVIHRTSQIYALPSGTRVGAAQRAYMATLVSPSNTAPAINVEQGASYHQFEGLEIAANPTPGSDPFYVVLLGYQGPGSPGLSDNQRSDLTDHIVFDRCYIHNSVGVNGRTISAVFANTKYFELDNSTVMIFNDTSETHAVSGFNGEGPLYFNNNEFRSSQIGTMFGGAQPTITGIRAKSASFLGNYYYRPWAWRVTSGTADPADTFYPPTCMYDSNGGESYINATSGHWWLCVGGTWTDQGLGTPSQPYCRTFACTAGGATNLVCSISAPGAMSMTCNSVAGVSVGMLILGPGLSNGADNVASILGNTITLADSPAAAAVAAAIYQFASYAALDAGVVFPYCTAGCSIDKNHFEIKNGWGFTAEGNWIQNGWQPAMLGQKGECTLLNQVDDSGPGDSEPQAVIFGLTFANNVCDSTGHGFDIGLEGGPYNHVPGELSFSNNLFTNIGLTNIVGEGNFDATLVEIFNATTIAFNHNTLLLNNAYKGALGYGQLVEMNPALWGNAACDGPPPPGVPPPGILTWTNNIAVHGYWGLYDSCDSLGSSDGAIPLDYPKANIQSSIVITTETASCQPGGSGNCGQLEWSGGSGGCLSCWFPTSFASVFSNYPSNLTVNPSYAGKAQYGTAPGADMEVVQSSTQGAVSGAPNPYLNFQVTAAAAGNGTAAFTYTAPDTGACKLTVASNGGYVSPAYNASDYGGNPARYVLVTGLESKARYWWKMVCGEAAYGRSGTLITQ
jgi:hypothetical protein